MNRRRITPVTVFRANCTPVSIDCLAPPNGAAKFHANIFANPLLANILPAAIDPQWIYLALASAGIGFSKAGFPGISMLHVVVFALCFGSKESTGILLPMLIVGDVCAITMFGRRAVWAEIFKLLPPTILGILVGWYLIDRLDPLVFRWTVGTIILSLAAIQAYRMFRQTSGHRDEAATTNSATTNSATAIQSFSLAAVLGGLAGATTMMANAAGPVVAMYFLIIRLPKWELIGTSAWLFLVLNVIKLPLSYELGLINQTTLRTGAMLAPMIPVGMLAGRWLVSRISQKLFNAILLGFTAIMAIRLIAG